jgi:hypothetical protein
MHKLFILLWLVSLSGCGGLMMAGVPGLAQIDLVTVMGTDKTVIDHVVSVSSGKNCSSIRLEQGDYYCEEDEPRINPNINCYKTLGRVTCYTKSDPYNEGYQKVGENDHNLIDPHAQKRR